MIRISYRDIDRELKLSPEESNLKLKLMDEMSDYSIDDKWNEFVSAVNSNVEEVVDNHIKSIYEKDSRYKKVKEIESRWNQLSLDVRQGKVESPEADEIQKEWDVAEEDFENYKAELIEGMQNVKRAIVAQLISWKVD
jgi:hypothetical protein